MGEQQLLSHPLCPRCLSLLPTEIYHQTYCRLREGCLHSVQHETVSVPCQRNGTRPSNSIPLQMHGYTSILAYYVHSYMRYLRKHRLSCVPVVSGVMPNFPISGSVLGSTRTAQGKWLTLYSSSGRTSWIFNKM